MLPKKSDVGSRTESPIEHTSVHRDGYPSQKQLGVEGAKTDGKGLDGTNFCWIVIHDVGV